MGDDYDDGYDDYDKVAGPPGGIPTIPGLGSFAQTGGPVGAEPNLAPLEPRVQDPITDKTADNIRMMAERGNWRAATIMIDTYLQDNQRRFVALRRWSTGGDDIASLSTADPAQLAAELPDEPPTETVANSIAIMCGMANEALELAGELFDALDRRDQRATVRTGLALVVARSSRI